MTTIRVSCTDQVLRLVERPTLASGGVKEAVVVFDFCEKWDGYAKTAVFYRDEEQLYPMLLENDSCFIPWEVYQTPGTFYFTVFGVKDEVRKTANTLRYKATKGIPEGEMIPSEPTQEMYEQMLGRLEKLEQNGDTGGGVSDEQLAEAVTEALEEAKASGDFKGDPGYTPIKGVDYFDGQNGKDGKDGYTPVKGVDYFDGQDGKDGADGKDGQPGADGKDYVLTEADKQEIAEQAAEMVEIPSGGGSGGNDFTLLDTFDFDTGALSFERTNLNVKEIVLICPTTLSVSASLKINGDTAAPIVSIKNDVAYLHCWWVDGNLITIGPRNSNTGEQLVIQRRAYVGGTAINTIKVAASGASSGQVLVYAR